MSDKPYRLAGRAHALLPKLKLEPAEEVLVTASHAPAEAAALLVGAGLPAAALKLAAWALGRREAVWWAVEFVASQMPASAPPPEKAALEAARKWVGTPSEENRRAAEAASAAVDYGTPAGQAAIAACWSGGSLSLPKLPVVPPPEHLLPRAVANAVLLAVLTGDPAQAGDQFRAALALAGDVADGKSRWKEDGPAPKR